MTIPSKYEIFLICLQAAAVVADIRNREERAAGAIAAVQSTGASGLPAIINGQTTPVEDMVNEYVNYVWDGGAKPDWLEQAGL